MNKYNVLVLLALGYLLGERMLTLTPPTSDTGGKRTEVQVLFEELFKNKLLQVQPDASIVLLQPDQALAAEWKGQPLSNTAKQLLTDLYERAAGVALRNQVNLWNRSRRITAVRDNGTSQGITNSSWRAHNCGDSTLLDANALVAESFGYVHQGHLRTGFGEWTAVAASSTCIEWNGQFQAKQPLPLEIWYVGQAINNVQHDHPGTVTAYAPPRQQQLPSCVTTAIAAEQAGSWQVEKSAWQQSKTGNWQLSLRFQLSPAQNPSLAPQGLQIGLTDNCQPQWQAAASTHDKVAAANWSVETADGIPLLTESSIATPQAQALGLLSIVGYGSNDTHGLGERLLFTPPGGKLTLTIDSRIQERASAALAAELKRLPQSDWAAERKAALVVLSADGAIRAAVGFPTLPALNQVTSWDLAAFARVYPLENPLLVRAWEGVDRHQAAGSTLKPVTALTALAATADPVIARMLNGMSLREFQTVTGLGAKDFKIDPYRSVAGGHPGSGSTGIKNFHLEPLAKLLTKDGQSGTCPGQGPDRYDLSLVSAVRESMNIWFIALAMLLDGSAADSYQHDPRPLSLRPPPNLRLIQTLRSLGFGTPSALFANPPKSWGKSGPKSVADQFDLLGNTPTPIRWVLAETAIGQGALVTPLRMATLAATIANDAKIQPHLDAAWNGKASTLSSPEALGIDTALLKRGMQAVVQLGTAHTAFLKMPAIRCHTYAKTGTAQVAKSNSPNQLESYGSAWTIGWYQPSSEKPPLAFACLITHTHSTGGEACGPVIAEFLQSL